MSTSWRRPIVAACLAALFAVLAAATPRIGRTAEPGCAEDQRGRVDRPSVADFVELINNGPAAEIGGYVVKDNDDTHVFTVPAGTTIAAGGYYVADTDARPGGFGLGSADSARLFAPGGDHAARQLQLDRARRDDLRPLPQRHRRLHDDDGLDEGRGEQTAAPRRRDVRINEVESNGGAPVDFVELINNGAAPADIGGYVIKDNDDTHIFTIPAGTTIAAGGYYVADTDTGPAASAWARRTRPACSRRADLAGRQLRWTAHAATTYGRCPNGTGAFTTTTASDQGRGERLPRRRHRPAVAGRQRRRHRRRRQRVRHEPQRPRLPAVRLRQPRRAVGGAQRAEHALPPRLRRHEMDAGHGQRLERRQAAALPRRHRRSGRRGRDPRRQRPGQRDLRRHRAQQQRQRRQPPRASCASTCRRRHRPSSRRTTGT